MKSYENDAFEMSEDHRHDRKDKDVEKMKEGEDCGREYGMGSFVEESKESRPAWDNQVQFLLACISMAVGLGNIWRFPYLAQTYGGGAFLIPYLLMLVFEGIPLFFIELAIGQRLRRGSMKAWERFHPYLKGIGFASMLTSFLIGLYYNTIVAWCFWYLFNSFQEPLPFANCPLNVNKTGVDLTCESTGPTEYFWYRNTLAITDSMYETGGLKWWIVICLVLAWFTVWVAMLNGIESSGKVMYFTATCPYLVLLIFLIRGLTLPGSSDGLSYLFTPDLEVLANPQVWLDAATQIFFSLSVGMGGVIAFASYNPKKQDCQRDVLIISLVNSFTSIFASMVIFSVLGYKATVQFDKCVDNNTEVMLDFFDMGQGSINQENYDDKFAEFEATNGPLAVCDLYTILNEKSQGTGLAFVVFTEAIISMPGSPVWSVLFFLMLLSLGLGTMFGTVEGVCTPLFDLGLKVPKAVLTGIVSVVSCIIGLVFCTGAGNYWLAIFNDYAGSIPLLVITFFEVVVVAWGYGTKRFDEDLAWMIGGPKSVMGWILHYYFRICWTFLSPVILLVVFAAYLYVTATSTLTYEVWVDGSTSDQEYPWYGIMMIVLLICLPLVCIPGFWIAKALAHNCSSSSGRKKKEGILCSLEWKLSNLAWWSNKYDKQGNLKR